MKSKPLLITLLSFFMFYSCGKNGGKPGKDKHKITICIPGDPYAYLNQYHIDSICTSDLCKKYQIIWKDLFLKKNNLTDSFFDKHIQLMQSSISNWDDGVSYNICYRIHSDWAIAYNCDQFIINIKDTVKNLDTNLPRDEYLSEDDIKVVLHKRIHSSRILNLSDSTALKYPSMQDALQNLILAANVTTLCMGRVYINNLGHLTLEASAQYADKDNACITASLDLVTRITTTKDGPCQIE